MLIKAANIFCRSAFPSQMPKRIIHTFYCSAFPLKCLKEQDILFRRSELNPDFFYFRIRTIFFPSIFDQIRTQFARISHPTLFIGKENFSMIIGNLIRYHWCFLESRIAFFQRDFHISALISLQLNLHIFLFSAFSNAQLIGWCF